MSGFQLALQLQENVSFVVLELHSHPQKSLRYAVHQLQAVLIRLIAIENLLLLGQSSTIRHSDVDLIDREF